MRRYWLVELDHLVFDDLGGEAYASPTVGAEPQLAYGSHFSSQTFPSSLSHPAFPVGMPNQISPLKTASEEDLQSSVRATEYQAIMNAIREFQSQIGTQADTASAIASGPQARQVEKPGFGEAVKNALAAVNETQANARATAEAYEKGAEIPLAEVVMGMQKASLAFEATLQVRNKVLKAYEDILNMPV